MSPLEEALIFDKQQDVKSATSRYEDAIEQGAMTEEGYLNLIALYVAFSDYGFAAHHQLDRIAQAMAEERVKQLIAKCGELYPKQTEFDFWRRVCQLEIEGKEWHDVFPPDYELKAQAGESLVPYIALFLGSNGLKYRDEVKMLCADIASQETHRKRDLFSRARTKAISRPLGDC